ncbi:MAG: SDR family oxidoreductase [Bacillota bacterium]
MNEIKDKLFVITGGGNGIGKAIATHVLENGGCVAIIDTDTAKIQTEFEKYKTKTLIYNGDLSIKADMDKFCEKVIAFGKVFCLINNACKTHGGMLHPCGYEDFMKTLAVGVGAPYYLTSVLKDNFQNGGSVINISSTRAHQSQKSTESYSSAKGGICALTHAMAISLGGKIRVNSIAPGWIDTTESEFFGADNTQHPAGRVGKPCDIVEMAMYLASEKAGFITGSEFVVDGGMSKLMVYHNDENWQLEE